MRVGKSYGQTAESDAHTLPSIMALGAIGVALSYFGLIDPQYLWQNRNVTPFVGWLILLLTAFIWLPYSFATLSAWLSLVARMSALLAVGGLISAEALQGHPQSAVILVWTLALLASPWVHPLRKRSMPDLTLVFGTLLSVYGILNQSVYLSVLALIAGVLLLANSARPRPILVMAAGIALATAAIVELRDPRLVVVSLVAINALGLLTSNFVVESKGVTFKYFRSMALVGTIPLLILGSFLTFTGQGQVLKQSLSHLSYTASQSAQAIEQEVWSSVGVVSELSHSPALLSSLREEDLNGLESVLDNSFSFHPSLAYLGLVRSDLSVMAERRSSGNLSIEVLQKIAENRYELFVAGQPMGPEPYIDSQGKGFLIAAFPVDSNGMRTVLVGAISMDRIDVRFHQVAGPTQFHHMLVDPSKDQVISDHDTRQRMIALSAQGWPSYLLETLLNQETTFVPRGDTQVYAAYAPIPSWGWGVIVYAPIAEALGGAIWISWANLAILLASLGITLGLSLVSSQELTLPILNLSWTARKIKEGDLNTQTIHSTGDAEGELGEIASTLNVLVEKIVRADQEIDEHARRLQDVTRQSQALRAANQRLTTLLSLAQDALRLDSHALFHSATEKLAITCSASATLWQLHGGKCFPVASYSHEEHVAAEASPLPQVLAAAKARTSFVSPMKSADGAPVGWVMAVPIVVEDNVEAAIELRRDSRFELSEQQMVEVAATEIAMAIQLDRLYSSTRHQANLYKQIGHMAEHSMVLLDPQANLQNTLAYLMEMTGARCGMAHYLQANGQLISLDRALQCMISPQALLERLAPYLIGNDAIHANEFRGELPILGVDTWIALGLKIEDRVRGIVMLGFSPYRPLSDEERSALRLAARMASLSLQRCELYAATMEQRDLATTIVNTVPMAVVLIDVWEKEILMANGAAVSAGLDNVAILMEAGFWSPVVRTAEWHLPYRAREIQWTKGDTTTYWDLSLWPLSQSPGMVLLSAQEVTSSIIYRERIHSLAREAEQGRSYLQSILNSMTEGIVIVAEDGTITFANPRANLLLGAGYLGRSTIRDLADSLEARARIDRQVRDFLLGMGDPIDSLEFDLNYARVKTVSCQWFKLSGSANEGTRGLLVRDVTLQRELNRFRENLISIVSHELRTPLTSILGFSELATIKEFPAAELKRMLKMIHQEASQMSDLVNEFLEAGKLSAQGFRPHPTPIDLAQIIDHSVTIFRRRAPHHTFEVTVPDKLPTLHADEPGVRQVLQNLLGNAVKYTPEPGKISISVSLSDNEVTIAISDTGLGIPPDQLDKIFERFYRVTDHSHRSIRGTGLGLSIARDIVASHGGRIWAESQPGKGSTFYVTLPLSIYPPDQ